MIKNIIVEGPDCSGKSTLVDRIKNTLRWDSKSLHHMEGNQFYRYLKEYALLEKTVIDRSHLSEEVYSILWRGGTPFTSQEKNILDEICKIDTLIVFTCPDIETMQERYNKRNFQQQIKFEELEKSRELFCKQFENLPHCLYKAKTFEELDFLVTLVHNICTCNNCQTESAIAMIKLKLSRFGYEA